MNGNIIFFLIFLCFAFQFVHCGKSKGKKGLWEVDSDDDEPNDSTKTEKPSGSKPKPEKPSGSSTSSNKGIYQFNKFLEILIILKYVSTKNTFSDDDKEVAKFEKEIKSLKAQIKDFKEMIADVKKIKDETTNCKKDLEKFLSKIKLDIYKPDK